MTPQDDTPPIKEDAAPAGGTAEPPKEAPRFNWEFREEFRINKQMREVVTLTKAVAESEIERLRRKVEKLTYGS
jgi:hypothetical protein